LSLDGREEPRRRDRLLDELADAELPRTSFLREVAGDDDDGDVRELGIGLHPLPELPPVYAGHTQVEQDSARTQPNTELAQSVRRTPGGFDREAVENQEGGKSGAHVVIVIDNN
jgi:hypothetical protein